MNQKSLVWPEEGFSGHPVLYMLLYKLHTSFPSPDPSLTSPFFLTEDGFIL